MRRIRVLIANQPLLVRELFSATITDPPVIELVENVGKQNDLSEAVAKPRRTCRSCLSISGTVPAQFGFLFGILAWDKSL